MMGIQLKKMKGFSFMSMNVAVLILLILVVLVHTPAAHTTGSHAGAGDGGQPLSKIAIHRAMYELHENASVRAAPLVLGTKVMYLYNYTFIFVYLYQYFCHSR